MKKSLDMLPKTATSDTSKQRSTCCFDMLLVWTGLYADDRRTTKVDQLCWPTISVNKSCPTFSWQTSDFLLANFSSARV